VRFLKESRIAAPAARVWAFHEAPDALMQLTPPWQKMDVIQPPASLRVGTRVILRARLGPLRQTIEAEHVEYEEGRMFADRMVRGPFPKWLHRHVITPIDDARCTLTDDVEYELPLGALGRVFGAAIARRELTRLFDYRHAVTKRACEASE
jgi:ligand-binding SRPBCC domain-containing protein